MIDVQLYIEDERIDLFDDETIELTSTIQNVRDIAKVFADYSQTFTVPANERNNKLFKHFYNFDIDGFNATTKKRARIQLNHSPFREGFIYVEGCNLKNNVANTYTLVFYGGLVLLKDKIKDHTLQSLVGQLEQYNHQYSDANVRTGFTTGLNSEDIIYPLITPEKRLYFDSVSADSNTNYSGNLFSDLTPSTIRGLSYLDLKPAIKVIKIIKAIEEKYSIDFTGFFDTDDDKRVTQLENLYLWLSRDSGRIIDYNSDAVNSLKFTGFASTDAQEDLTIVDDVWNFFAPVQNQNDGNKISFQSELTISNINPSTRSVTIKAIDQITGDTMGEQVVTGSNPVPVVYFHFGASTNPESKFYAAEGRSFEIIFIAECDGDVNFSASLKLYKTITNINVEGNLGRPVSNYTVFSNGTGTTFADMKISNQLPDMKILDFLTGLFKMFNLTAYVNEPIPLDANGNYNPVIDIKTLDDYYADAILNTSTGTIDLSQEIDIEAHSVKAARPFTKVSLEYEETETVLMQQHKATHNKSFGNTSFPKGEGFDFIGEEYNVELPFSHLKYERLYDSGVAGSDTEIQWGYAAGGTFKHEDSTEVSPVPIGNYNPVNIKPLLFYGIKQTISDTSKKINWNTGTATGLSTYWRPSNSNEEGGGTAETAPAFNLNFDSEFDEWYRLDYLDTYLDSEGIPILSDNSLFAIYYSNYISSIYESKKRIFEYNAYLPAKILTTYKLNDQIKIQNNLFHINTMNTNLTTGQTKLELINIVPNFSPIVPSPSIVPNGRYLSSGGQEGYSSTSAANACADITANNTFYWSSTLDKFVKFDEAEYIVRNAALAIPPDGWYASSITTTGERMVRQSISGILQTATNCS